ncbi:arsenic resistance N-acetyltransferase ArsN2 [Agrobacterium rosae]|uniref:arsenic resistance N-acetyltransferase ArsN2 n=1 Tax=Agrobacterium rosae TaxID=1972867 RepID=UPI003BA329D4
MLLTGGETMLNAISLKQVSGSDPELRQALVEAHLPTDDIEDGGRIFYKAVAGDGSSVGYCGIERCGDCRLLRSVVVDPGRRGRGFGRAIVEATLRESNGYSDTYLATTTAAPFFSIIGFSEVPRDIVPPAVLATRQLSSICPSSATIMKLQRPPT